MMKQQSKLAPKMEKGKSMRPGGVTSPPEIAQPINPIYTVKANDRVEADKEDLHQQILSSWAHNAGLSSKSGAVLNHTLRAQKLEQEAVLKIQKYNTKSSNKVKTKGRFVVEYATIGKLYNVDHGWAKKANPSVYAVL